MSTNLENKGFSVTKVTKNEVKMTDISVKQMIKKYGEKTYNGNRVSQAVVKCTVCKKRIQMTEDLEDVGFSLTKRGTPLFVHHKCFKKYWEAKL